MKILGNAYLQGQMNPMPEQVRPATLHLLADNFVVEGRAVTCRECRGLAGGFFHHAAPLIWLE